MIPKTLVKCTCSHRSQVIYNVKYNALSSINKVCAAMRLEIQRKLPKLTNLKTIFLTLQMCIETFTKTATLEVVRFGYFQSVFCVFTISYCNKHAILQIDPIA